MKRFHSLFIMLGIFCLGHSKAIIYPIYRAENFAFNQNPEVVRQENGTYLITFSVQDYCDVTVSILNRDGYVIRHLASGVLGDNAPQPFQKSALSQSLVWDGLDDRYRPVTDTSCQVRVSLGLKPKFDRNLIYDPLLIMTGGGGSQVAPYSTNTLPIVATAANGDKYILGTPAGSLGSTVPIGRVFDSTGRFLRTFWPPSAKKLRDLNALKSSFTLAKTRWGDDVPATGTFMRSDGLQAIGISDTRQLPIRNLVQPMFALEGFDVYDTTVCRLETFPASVKAYIKDSVFSKPGLWRMAADRMRDELFFRGKKYDVLTGKVNPAFALKGQMDEVCFGSDDYLYVRIGTSGYGQWIARLNRLTGAPVDFNAAGNSVMTLPRDHKWPDGTSIYGGYYPPWSFDVKVIWMGLKEHSNVHDRGLYVSPNSQIVISMMCAGNYQPSGLYPNGSTIKVFDTTGNLLTNDAVGNMADGHGVTMDREGNIYAAMAQTVPTPQYQYFGLESSPGFVFQTFSGHGSIIKFASRATFPLGTVTATPAQTDSQIIPVKTSWTGTPNPVPNKAISGADWAFGCLVGQDGGTGCSCDHFRYDMDYYARHFLLTNQLRSILVIDANGNVIARVGKYGNVDDGDEDLAVGGDGVSLAWPRALAVSDKGLYVADPANARVFRVALNYAQEITLSLSSGAVVSQENRMKQGPSMILYQNVPNPSAGRTGISYYLPTRENVSLRIVDITGKVIKECYPGVQGRGMHTLRLETNKLGTGVYIYELSAGAMKARKQMLVIR